MTDVESVLRATAPRVTTVPADLADRVATAAGREGLVDVAYALTETPLGLLLIAATPRGLVRTAFTGAESIDDVLTDLAARVSPRVLEAPARVDAVRRQIDEYFSGARHEFSLDLDWTLVSGYFRRVLDETARIPFGGVSTYSDVAAAAGSPRAVRAAGNALAANPICVVVPCHRVLRRGGGLGGYGGGLERKAALLRLEGVTAI